MTTAATSPTTVTQEIVVEAPPERAFAVFVEQFDRIKPRDHNLLAAPIVETVFEPRVGGTAREGVAGEGGWPLYLRRYVEVLETS